VTGAVAARPGAARRALTATLAAVVPYLVSVVAAFVVAGIVIAALGHNPFVAFRSVVTTSFATSFGVVETFTKWVPLTLLALAFAIPLGAGRFNIGGEGQLILGATGAAAVGITLSDLPLPVLLPLVLIAGILGGGLWAGIAAWLMSRFRINEILSTVLLNFVSFQVLDYVASEVWPDVGAGFPATVKVADAAMLPTVGRPAMHIGVFITAGVVLVGALLMRRSVPGFELRAVGINERAARVHGIRTSRVAVGAVVVGGMAAGLSGAIEVSGVHGNLLEGIQSNYLLLGIIIGLIARGSVVLVPFVAFGISILEIGASAMQRSAQVPAELVLIVEGLILLFLLLSDVLAARLRRRRPSGGPAAPAGSPVPADAAPVGLGPAGSSGTSGATVAPVTAGGHP
jgi:simple sugar transport system permease protein